MTHNDRPAWSEPRTSAGTVLSGSVRSELRPLADVILTVTDRAGTQRARARTGADGTFQVTGLPRGSYIVVFSRAGYQPQAALVTCGDARAHVEVVLEPTAGVSGFVRDRQSREAVAAATVTAVGPGGEVIASTVSDPDGAYRIDGIDAAELTLVAAAPGADPVATVVRLDPGRNGPVHTVDRLLDTYSTLVGTVTSDGRPLADLPLVLRDERGAVRATTVTDEDGTYRFDRLTPGRYTVTTATAEPAANTIGAHTTVADLALAPRGHEG